MFAGSHVCRFLYKHETSLTIFDYFRIFSKSFPLNAVHRGSREGRTGSHMYACVYSPDVTNYPALVNCAYAFSPLVEETDPNTVVLDIEGCGMLFGSSREIAKEIERNALASGLNVNIAVAQNPDAAIHAARSFA